MTLNSVDWEELVLVRDTITKKTIILPIGEFIDNLINQNSKNVQHLGDNLNEEMGNVQYLDIKDKQIFIPSVDENGKVSWKLIEAVTKHLPINLDGTNTLVKIKTKMGREVTATKAKSFLTNINNKILPIRGDEIKIGTILPITQNFANNLEFDNEYNLIEHFPKQLQNTKSTILKQIKLDATFGFIVGAYIAEGWTCTNVVGISNNNENYIQAIKEFADKYEIGYLNFKHTDVSSKNQKYSLELHSTLLANLLEQNCGKLIHDKQVPDFAYMATNEFLKGFFDGYIGGNNDVFTEKSMYIEMTSVSKKLIVGLSSLLTRFGITSNVLTESPTKEYTLVFKNENIKTINDLALVENESDVFYDEIISIEEVQPSNTYVYDFTVADTKNFALANGLQMRDSFHHAGIASMSATVQGVPRMKELLSVSKNPKTPQMVIYLTPEYMSNKDMAHKIASHIKYTTLGDTRGRINVYYDENAKGGFMEKDNIKNLSFGNKNSRSSCQSDATSLPWLMRIELDREKMLEKEVTLLEIKNKFCSWWEKRFDNSKVVKGEEKKVLNKINQLTILSNSDNDEQPVLHIRFNVKDGEKDKFNMGTVDNFIDLIVDKFKLKGLNSIIDIPAIQEERLLVINEETGNEDKLTHHVIYATGVNLLDIRYFNGVDLNKTITNNIMDVYETFGIEIARAVLMKEIIGAYSNAGGEVNYQHVTMIVDQMTAMGTINSIDRHGMNKSDSDPLARASFEKTVEQLLIASVYGETDYMRSVSSRIMAGAVIKGGTGFCEIEFDTDLVEKSEYVEGIDYTKKFTELHENTLAHDVIGKKDDDIFIPM